MKTISLVKPPESRNLKSSRVMLSPGEDVGEHVTNGREEILVVLKGEVTILFGNNAMLLKEGQMHFIAEGVTHNVYNSSPEESEYIYVVAMLS